MRARQRVAAAILVIGAAPIPVQADTMYAIDDGDNNLYTIDLASGAATLVGATNGPPGQDPSLTGLAFDTSTGIMYVSDIELPDPNPSSAFGLGTVDLATGVVTIVGAHVITDNMWGLAYDSLNDELYGSTPDDLATIDRATGAATGVGSFGPGIQIRGLAYDASTDTLYGVDVINLNTIDRSTGAATAVGPHGLALSSGGLEVDPDTGILYLGSSQTSSLYRLDKATGAATLIGPSGIAIDSLGAVPALLSVLEIPTMTPLGLALLAALLIVAGWMVIRHSMHTA